MTKNTESLSEEERLFLALRETGIDLEWKTAAILESCGFTVKINQRGNARDSVDGPLVVAPETDVLAEKQITHNGDRLVVFVECKGSPSEGVLILIESTPEKYRSIPRIFFRAGGVIVDALSCIMPSPSEGLFRSENGDILHPSKNGGKDSGFQRASKESNLFKGINQLCEGIDSNALEYFQRTETTEILPIFVTNAKLRLARLSRNEILEVPWVFYQNPLVYTSQHSFMGHRTWVNERGNEVIEKQLPGAWIIQYERLLDFLTCYPNLRTK